MPLCTDLPYIDGATTAMSVPRQRVRGFESTRITGEQEQRDVAATFICCKIERVVGGVECRCRLPPLTPLPVVAGGDVQEWYHLPFIAVTRPSCERGHFSLLRHVLVFVCSARVRHVRGRLEPPKIGG